MKAINCMVDWLEFSVFDLTLNDVMSALDLKEFKFEQVRSKWYSVNFMFDRMITVSTGFFGKSKDARSKNHVHVKISGKGCRFLEKHYNGMDIRTEILGRLDSFYLDNADETVLGGLRNIEIKVSRLDICADFDQKFLLSIFEDSIKNYRFKGIRVYDSAGSYGSGMTYYLGSRISDKFFRVYEKDKESGDAKFKDRVELVLRDTYATAEFTNESDLIKILSSYMNDITWDDETVQEVWDSMKSETCEISPKIRHKKTTLKEKGEYVLNTYAKTLKAYAEQYGTLDISKAIHDAVLSEKDIRMIENAKVVDMVKHRKKLAERRKFAQDGVDFYAYKQGHKTVEQLSISI